jgi:hypothetical protein
MPIAEKPMRTLLLAALLLVPATSWPSDLHRLSFLEQEVRNLQRQVLALSRQVEDLARRPDELKLSPRPSGNQPRASSDAWIDADKWRRVKPGMSELQVIELLGAPTSMRDHDDTRVLFYALEVGASGFLGGSVRLRDRAVVDIREPTLQ